MLSPGCRDVWHESDITRCLQHPIADVGGELLRIVAAKRRSVGGDVIAAAVRPCTKVQKPNHRLQGIVQGQCSRGNGFARSTILIRSAVFERQLCAP